MTPAQYQQVLKGLGTSASGLSQWVRQSNPDMARSLGTAGNIAGGGASALGMIGGIQQGGVAGDVSAAANAARLAGRTGIFGANTGSVNMGATGALDALAIYQGLQRGGVQGYGQALGAGMQGAGMLMGNAGLSAAGGYVLAPLAVYNAVNNWESGRTGSDALQGAEAGAAIGSIVGPVGTLIGGVIGGAAGALSSAFGPGAKDPEQSSWGGYVGAYNQANQAGHASDLTSQVSNPYMPLAGLFDLRNGQIGGNIPMYDQYGRMGEQKFTTDMTKQIQDAINKGTITSGDDASSIYSKVVDPWIGSFGKGANTDVNAGAMKGLLTQMVSQYMGGQAPTAWTDIDRGSPFANLAGPNWGTAPKTTTTAAPAQGNSALTTIAHPQMGLAPRPQVPAPQAATPQAQSFMASPSNTGSPMTQQDWFTYGSRPEAQFFQNNFVPLAQATGVSAHAEGGSMKRKSALDTVYRGNFRDRQGFDDGGLAYFSDPNLGVYDTVSGAGDFNAQFSPYSGVDPNYSSNPNMDPGYSFADYGSSGPSASSSPSKTQQQLNNLKANLSGSNGITGILNILKGLTPIAGALLSHGNTNLTKPQGVPGMTAGASSPRAPSFNRSQVMNPSNLPGGSPMSQKDWYTYGSRPEAQFFKNDAVPLAQTTGVTGKARGGGALQSLDEGQPPLEGEFDSSIEHHAEGPGDGTSDDIPAKLSDGEYVMDANTVSLLGNGSNKAGAARLDDLRANLRKHAAKSMSKGKQFMKAKPPEQYMKAGRKEKASG